MQKQVDRLINRIDCLEKKKFDWNEDEYNACIIIN